jgi:hypothetical protein
MATGAPVSRPNKLAASSAFGFDDPKGTMSDNTPTERFDSPAPAANDGAVVKKRNSLLYLLIGIGTLLLLALVTVIILMLNRGTGQPVAAVGPDSSQSASPSSDSSDLPSASPSAVNSASPSTAPSAKQTNAPPPPPADTKPHFTTFQVPTQESGCGTGPNFSFVPPIKVKWVAVNAASVWFVQGTSDAVESQYQQLPTSGNQNDFKPYGPPNFTCNGQSATYTLTILGTDGSHFSKHWTVKDTSKY